MNNVAALILALSSWLLSLKPSLPQFYHFLNSWVIVDYYITIFYMSAVICLFVQDISATAGIRTLHPNNLSVLIPGRIHHVDLVIVHSRNSGRSTLWRCLLQILPHGADTCVSFTTGGWLYTWLPVGMAGWSRSTLLVCIFNTYVLLFLKLCQEQATRTKIKIQ